jgi:hypothetical protein
VRIRFVAVEHAVGPVEVLADGVGIAGEGL